MVARCGCIVLALMVGLAGEAWGADPAVTAADSTVRLGLGPGYTGNGRDAADGVVVGEAGANLLTPAVLDGFALPDLFTGVSYDFAGGASNAHAGDGNLAIVRLGLGRPFVQGGELIPYIAAGYQSWNPDAQSGGFDQAGLLGGGLKIDLPASRMLVLSASAEGLAIIGGAAPAPAHDFTASEDPGTEERVGLDADYRLGQFWHAYAGLGVTHYDFGRARQNGLDGNAGFGGALQVNSIFGVAYGF